MLAENRVREIVKVRLALFAPVLLCVLTGCTPSDNVFTFAMDTRHRLAGAGETETFEALLSWWQKDTSRLLVHRRMILDQPAKLMLWSIEMSVYGNC